MADQCATCGIRIGRGQNRHKFGSKTQCENCFRERPAVEKKESFLGFLFNAFMALPKNGKIAVLCVVGALIVYSLVDNADKPSNEDPVTTAEVFDVAAAAMQNACPASSPQTSLSWCSLVIGQESVEGGGSITLRANPLLDGAAPPLTAARSACLNLYSAYTAGTGDKPQDIEVFLDESGLYQKGRGKLVAWADDTNGCTDYTL